MDKYKLSKENKYLGQVEIKNNKIISKLFFKKNKIRIFSVVLALQLSFGVLYGFSKNTTRELDIKYMYENFYLDNESVSNELKWSGSKYKQLEDRYNKMTDEEKNDYVVLIFNTIIDNSDEFTDEEKDYLKEREGAFLKKYGHYYYFENIFGMTSRLRKIIVERDVDLERGIGGYYEPYVNKITMDKEMSNATLSHEVEHAITINKQIWPFFNSYEDLGLIYICESMDSSSDLSFHSLNSYFPSMRTHILFLSKIVGKDNLLKFYSNYDFKFLKKLLDDDYGELMSLFGKQLELTHESKGTDFKYCNEIADKLKDIYEKKNNCSIENDGLMKSLYEASKANSSTTISSTLYDDKIKITKDVLIDFFDDSHHACFSGFCDEDGVFYLKRGKMINGYRANIKGIGIRKLDYFIPDDEINKIVNSDNCFESLKLYLEELGVSNSLYWAYNILNNNFPVFCSSEIYNYDTKCFDSDLKKILKIKYNDLEKKGQLSNFYYGFDIFFDNKENVNEEKFEEFFDKKLNFDKNVKATDIINNSSKVKSSGRSK